MLIKQARQSAKAASPWKCLSLSSALIAPSFVELNGHFLNGCHLNNYFKNRYNARSFYQPFTGNTLYSDKV